ncbi:MAG: 16S rRNA (guanine(966)-N(2))-methyltransferase RsmD [Hyphomicrobiaceae bacterium]
MRVVGGQLRGRALVAPPGDATRPTSDRVREAVFNILAHGIPDFTIEGARVLDLFAGTGALGLEALSRGAAFCVFVEEAAEARGAIRANIETLGLTGATRIFRRDATMLGPAANRGAAHLVFADPPYGRGLGERALAAAAAGGWLMPGAIAVLEERKGTALQIPSGFTLLDQRDWGDTDVAFLRYKGAADA